MNATVPTAAPPPLAPRVWRLVRFDLLRFRLLAALMVVLEIARAIFVEWSLHMVPVGLGGMFGGTVGAGELELIDAGLWIAMAVATAIFVQADRPSDDRAFWRTRPIAPFAMALAKLTTLALLFVAVPVAINAGRLVAYHAPASAIGAAAVQIAVLAAFVIAPAWALALATRTLSRCVGAALALFVGGNLALGALFYWQSVWRGNGGTLGMVTVSLPAFLLDWQGTTSRGWWAALAMTIGSLAILTAHYWHRRRSVSIAAAAALLACSQLPIHPAPTPAAPALARVVSGHIGIASLWLPAQTLIDARRRSGASFPLALSVRFSFPDLPIDVSAALNLTQIDLTGGGSTPAVAVTDGTQCCFGPGPVAALGPLLAATGPPEGLNATDALGFGVDVDDLSRLRGGSVAVTGQADIRFTRHHLAGVIPLRAGSAIRVADQVIEILDVEPRRSMLLVRYTKFPSLDPDRSELSLFVGDAARTRAAATTMGWARTRRPIDALTAPREWAVGRTWVGRFHVVVAETAAFAPDARVYVVESRAAGTARLPLSVAGLPVQGQR